MSVSNLSLGFLYNQFFAGFARFTQSGGVNAVAGALTVGRATGPGFYTLAGGILSSAVAKLGDGSAGTFSQNGGTNIIDNDLYIGLNSGGFGDYDLNNGTLRVSSVVVGSNSAGTFSQFGSQVFFRSNVVLAVGPGSSGTYNLSNGIASTPQLTIGQSGAGRYFQSGGTNTIGGNLYLGYSSNSTGSVSLNRGFLTSESVLVGVFGRGIFNQSGGTNVVNRRLYLGFDPSGTGTYSLSNGLLAAGSLVVADSGRGNFTQQGGRTVITNDFSIGSGSGFTLQNGSVTVGAMQIASNAMVLLGKFNPTMDGGIITNNGLIQGAGSISNAIDNRGTISASNGVLSLFGSPLSSRVGTLLAVYPTATLFEGGGLAVNNGTIYVQGGTFDNNHHSLVNNGLVSGNGAFRAGRWFNTSTFFFTGRTNLSAIYGDVTNDVGGTIEVASNAASFFGNVFNNGTFNIHNGATKFAGIYAENGVFLSQQAQSVFNDLYIGLSGYIQAAMASQFYVAGNFYNVSAQASLWNTSSADLILDGGNRHLLQLAGEERGTNTGAFANNFMWGSLRLGAGQSLTLQDGNSGNGSALYVGTLTLDGGTNQIASITGNGLDIYYDANAPGNAYLGNGTFALGGGGYIEPAVIAPKISAVSNSTSGFVLQFDFVPGKSYVIEYSNDLKTWSAVFNPTLTSPASGIYQWRDDGSQTGGPALKVFYRIKVQ